jgi:hypothetical protein
MSSARPAPQHPAAVDGESELDGIARRLCWWQSPVEARRDPVRFAAQVMALGTDRDVEALARVWGDDVFDTVLDAPPPGLFTVRRWNYWNVRRRRQPSAPLPIRFPR